MMSLALVLLALGVVATILTEPYTNDRHMGCLGIMAGLVLLLVALLHWAFT
jgi:hypothetical protein